MLNEYIERVRNLPDAYEQYSVIYEQYESETVDQFIERCAVSDFNDGELQGCVYQEIYEELVDNG